MPTTANFGWTKPVNGGDGGAWGTELNATLDAIDTQVFKYLLKTGGALTGRIDTLTATTAASALGTVSGTVNLDVSLNNGFYCALNGTATTFAFINPPPNGLGMSFFLQIGAAGGATAVTWPASVKWPGGVAPVLSTGGGQDLLSFLSFNGGVTWYGVFIGKGFA